MHRLFERLILTTGSDEETEILKRRDAYFDHVLKGFSLSAANPFVKIETRAIGVESPTRLEASGDCAHALIIHDELVALVYDRRNDYNNHEVTFFTRRPSPKLLSFILNIRSR
jgi:hypothetical protein